MQQTTDSDENSEAYKARGEKGLEGNFLLPGKATGKYVDCWKYYILDL